MFRFVGWWKPPVAGGKIVGQNCNQPFAGRIDDAAANDTGGIASEAHTSRQRLLSAGVCFFEVVVQIKGNTRQIAEVLQQSKEREENRHGWI